MYILEGHAHPQNPTKMSLAKEGSAEGNRDSKEQTDVRI